jgi:hypothetical protein
MLYVRVRCLLSSTRAAARIPPSAVCVWNLNFCAGSFSIVYLFWVVSCCNLLPCIFDRRYFWAFSKRLFGSNFPKEILGWHDHHHWHYCYRVHRIRIVRPSAGKSYVNLIQYPIISTYMYVFFLNFLHVCIVPPTYNITDPTKFELAAQLATIWIWHILEQLNCCTTETGLQPHAHL